MTDPETDAKVAVILKLVGDYPADFMNILVPRVMEEPGGRQLLVDVMNDFQEWCTAEAHRLKALGVLDFEETSEGKVIQ